MLNVSLFGHLRLRVDGRVVRFSARPKVAPLLAYLLLQRDATISRDSVAFTLWPDDPEETARTNLRRHLGYLREALPSADVPWFVADAGTVAWNPAAPVWVDALEFQRLIVDRESRRRAVDLYGGELLSDCYDDWIIAARERYRVAYVTGLWDLAVEARGRRDVEAAAEYLNRILAEDPWREDAIRALMAVRYESADRAGALQLVAQFEKRLHDEMHVALMNETSALRRAIERDEPLPTVPLLRLSETVKPTPAEMFFAGRDAEMARLLASWSDAQSGGERAMIITGEAGIGKTRLACEFALEVESRGGRVLWGTNSVPESAPYQPFAEILRAGLSYVERLDLDDYDRGLLARFVPAFASNKTADDGGDGQRSRLFDVLADVLIRLARQRPSLLVIEDAHNAGLTTLAMLKHLITRARGHPLFVLVTLREGEDQSATALGALRYATWGEKVDVVALARLSQRAVAQIVIATPLLSDDETAASDLWSMSAGHPLFLVELMQTALETGRVHREGPVPAGLRQAIEQRIARLSPSARFLLDTASVVGTSFDLDVVGELVGWSEADFVAAADELVERRAIRESGNRSGFDFEFSHDVVASVAYAALGERERRRWHRRTARVAERYYAGRVDDLAVFIARHHDRGGAGHSAATYYLRAARRAAAVFANEEALGYVARGLALESVGETLRFDLFAVRISVHDRLCDRGAQRDDQRQLDRIASALVEQDRICQALRWRGLLHYRTGEEEEGRRIVAQFIEAARGDLRWEAEALRLDAMFMAQSGQNEAAFDKMTLALEKFSAAGNERDVMAAVVFQGLLAAILGRRGEAVQSTARAREIAETSDEMWFRLQLSYLESQVMTRFAEWKRLAGAASELLETATKIGDRMMMALAHDSLAIAFQRHIFDFASARRHFEESRTLFEDAEIAGLLTAYTNLAGIEIEIGRFDRAAALAERIVSESSTIGGPVWPAYAAETFAMVGCRKEDYGAALRWADSCIGSASAANEPLVECNGLLVKGVAQREGGEFVDAVATLHKSRRRAIEAGAPFFACLPAAELALTYAMNEDPKQARRWAEEALGTASAHVDGGAQRRSLPLLWSLARAFDVLDDGRRAGEILEQAHALYLEQLAYLTEEEDRRAFVAIPANVALERQYANRFVNSGR